MMIGKKKKAGSVVEPKHGEQYITMNEGLSGETKVKVFKRQPKGWVPIKGATTAPRGYIWISNNKGYFCGERKSALIKDNTYHKLFPSDVKQTKTMKAIKSKTNNNSVESKKRKAVTQADLNNSVQNFLKVKEHLKSGEARNLAFKKPMKFFREHSVDEAIKLLDKEAKKKK